MIVMDDCILNSNADELKAAMNHKLFLLKPGPCYSWVLMKTANLSLEIDMKRPSGSASIKIPLEVIPDCHYVSVLAQNTRVHGYV